MRIFVSSSFEDLGEHRAAAIRVLRQLGHEVLAMEDLIAVSAAPLAKVLEMVDRSEAYVGIFAWRYGYVPGKIPDPSAAPTAVSATPPPPAAPPPPLHKPTFRRWRARHMVRRRLPTTNICVRCSENFRSWLSC